jgi:uncharacterized membrane protein YfcA
MGFSGSVATAMIVLFFSTFIRSAIGFGDGLIAMPLLALVLGTRTASPVVAFAAAMIALTILLANWGKVDLRSVLRLVLASLVGIPFGLLLLRYAPDHLMKVILGSLLILYGVYSLVTPRLPIIQNNTWALGFGFVAGVLGGAYNTNGPPIVIYGTLRRWAPEHFRTTLQYYFFLSGLLILVGHGVAGLWTPDVLRIFLYSAPLVLLAIYAGGKVHHRIPVESFSHVVYAFLILMGVVFLI